MKTILVPTDFSKEANNALDVAYVIAKQTGAKIELLHIVEGIFEEKFSPGGNYMKEDGMNKVFIIKLIEKAHKDMKKLIEKKGYKDISVAFDVKVGSVFNHISEIITEKEIDMIVMGTKGQGGLKGLLVGSNTEKVVRLARCLVLAVKDKTENFALQNVVLATALDDYSSELIVSVRELQKIMNFKLHLLYVNTPSEFHSTEEAMVSLKEICRLYKLDNCTLNVINEYSVENGIMDYAYQVKADLIAMSTHGRKGIYHMFQGSISEDMVKYSGKPILTHLLS
ncbi:universal stress protein [Cytophagaceae bacterium ABcell3]|nr:universal stress protein [Cytophagaceae bacterium ABcell3]